MRQVSHFWRHSVLRFKEQKITATFTIIYQKTVIMGKKSEIKIEVDTDDKNIPEKITWSATDSVVAKPNEARAMLLSLWEPNEKTAFRIDLWTQEMMMDEMAQFTFQTMMGLAETFEHATQLNDQAKELRDFAQQFLQKFQSRQESAPKKDLKS